ncbi:fumarate hydratase [Ammoniphilus sp. CFH 90114]|uniref:fumarate hydratase n=1 Tax=Ammoniphilus sp. CFH 90114 TaxID=2493665 RepID=UPI00100FB978|nr:fumarate hydratase [Ammoniphilus sp. CFH 90114]RXT07210.1 fumarate hydratase [Ammoniphilus sp. CFH 90114]
MSKLIETGWQLKEQDYLDIEETCKELYIRSLKDLPPDIRAAVQKAYDKETYETGKQILSTILQNIDVADQENLLICQDTGLPVYFVKIGRNVRFDGLRLEDAIREGTKRATLEHPLRSSVCDTITRKNTGTAVGKKVPVLHWEFVEGSKVEILALPKGSGSENMSYLKMLYPAQGLDGVKKFIIECVVGSGANPCPPTLVGVGIGGTADLCTALAKKAAAREIGKPNPDPLIAALEQELLEAINLTGIGPNGLGGESTALAVHIESADTHITMNPVAVNMMCWPARRARGTFEENQKPVISY